MGVDWGEYYGTEDPNEMSAMIDGYRESRNASPEDDEEIYNNAVKELENVKALFCDDKEICFLADELIKWKWPYLFNVKPSITKKEVWDKALLDKNRQVVSRHLRWLNGFILKEE